MDRWLVVAVSRCLYRRSELGAYSNNLTASETWLGTPFDFQVGFIRDSSWANMRSDAAAAAAGAPYTRPTFWAIGLTPGLTATPVTSLASIAGGSNDADITFIAQQLLLTQASGDIWVRPGWEMNGDFYPWTIGGGLHTDFANAFIKWVTLFRAVSSRFKCSFCVNLTNINVPGGHFDPVLAYPGDSYVDAIEGDVYFDVNLQPDGGALFGYYKDVADRGLTWLYTFANTHSRPWGVIEWGINSDTATYWPIIDLMYNFLVANGASRSGYWDSNDNFSGKLSNNQYPTAATRFIADFGKPIITSAATASVAGGDAFSWPLTAGHTIVVWQIIGGADSSKFLISGSNLTMAAKDFSAPTDVGGNNVYDVQIRAVDARQQVSATQNFAVTVTAPVTDLYPAYDGAFDPVNSFYKVGAFKTNTLAAFLARPEVHFSSDPTAAISASGYLSADVYGLYVQLTSSAAWSVFTEQLTPTFSSGVYSTLCGLQRSVETSTRLTICRDGFTSPTQQARTTVRNGGAAVGTDTNYQSLGSAGTNVKLAITTLGTAVKYYGGGLLRRTESTVVFATKTLDQLTIGDNAGEAAWGALVKRILWKTSTDDAAALAWTP